MAQEDLLRAKSSGLALPTLSQQLGMAAELGARVLLQLSFSRSAPPAQPHGWDLHSTTPVVVTLSQTAAARRAKLDSHKYYKALFPSPLHSHVRTWESHAHQWLFIQSCCTCNVVKLRLAALPRLKPGLYCLHLLVLSYSS